MRTAGDQRYPSRGGCPQSPQAGGRADQYTQFDTALGGLHEAHDAAHGFIAGTIAQEHYSFHGPFVFLLHSNVDRLLAAWQRIPRQAWRLDPAQVYGSAAVSPTIVQDLQPWSGGSGLRPWAPPDNQQVPTNATDLDVVTPARYDVVLAGGTLAQNADSRVEVFARGDDNALSHIWQTAPNNGWSGWPSLGGNFPGQPVVYQNAYGRLEVFVRGDDNALWHIWQTAPNNGWSSWATLGGNIPSLTADT